jgi:hypothetical protein
LLELTTCAFTHRCVCAHVRVVALCWLPFVMDTCYESVPMVVVRR